MNFDVHNLCQKKQRVTERQGKSLSGGALNREIDSNILTKSEFVKDAYDEILFSAGSDVCKFAQEIYAGVLDSRKWAFTTLPKAKNGMAVAHQSMSRARSRLIEAARLEMKLDAFDPIEHAQALRLRETEAAAPVQKVGLLDHYVVVEDAVRQLLEAGH